MSKLNMTLVGIHLPCEDLELMAAFYRDMLNLPIHPRRLLPLDDGPTEDWIGFQTGPAMLVLKLRGRYDGAARAERAASVHISFIVSSPSEVDAMYLELDGRGVDFLVPPRDWPWAERACFFTDPEGNLIEIYAKL